VRPLTPTEGRVHERVRQFDDGVHECTPELSHQLHLRDQVPYADGTADGGDWRRPPVALHRGGIDEQDDVLTLPWPRHFAEFFAPLALWAFGVHRVDVGPPRSRREHDGFSRALVGQPLLHLALHVEDDQLGFDFLLVRVEPNTIEEL